MDSAIGRRKKGQLQITAKHEVLEAARDRYLIEGKWMVSYS